jgi:hypothetical protein
MRLAAGFLALFLGLLGMLVSVHFRSARFFDRPALARRRHFDRVLDVLKWLLTAGGLALVAVASPTTGVLCGALLAAAAVYLRVIRSTGFRARRLRREYEALRGRRPGLAADRVLYELAMRRHPQWGPELIEQMVHDYPTIEAFAVMVARMEGGFRGFRTRVRRG